jgi:alpha-beta hydrolase superfamily lysophospholipase
MTALTGEAEVVQNENASTGVRRQAGLLDSRGQRIFAFLDWPDPAPAGRRAVLICPPLGHEQVHAHRALRHLANALSRAGFIACRLDYHGTGDSSGGDEDADRLAAWEGSVRDTIDWLRATHGCDEVHLVGLRLGALLALRVAAEVSVDSVTLWAPVVKGRQYVREMQALEMTAPSQANSASAAGDIEAAGFVITAQTASDLGKLDALTIVPKCSRVFIAARDDRPDNRALVEHLASHGIDARQTRVPGYAGMMAEPHFTAIPHAAIDGIVETLRSFATPSSVVEPSNGLTPMPLPAVDAVIGDAREAAVTIAGPPDLFGILTEPARGADGGRPLIVILNAGASYHVGPNRLNVLLARRLASAGFRCLRIDTARYGDSLVPAADAVIDNAIDTYHASVFRDLDSILRAAAVRWKASEVVVMGLCSGAYFAFQAAVQFSNPALVEVVMINPLAFFWAEGMTLRSPEALGVAEFDSHLRSVFDPAKLWKFMTGRSKLGFVRAAKAIVKRLRARGHGKMPASLAPTPINDRDVSHPAREHLAADVQQADANGRRLTFVFAEGDPGQSILKHFAGSTVKKLCRAGKADVYTIPRADHTFTRRADRREFFETLVRHFERIYPSRGET